MIVPVTITVDIPEIKREELPADGVVDLQIVLDVKCHKSVPESVQDYLVLTGFKSAFMTYIKTVVEQGVNCTCPNCSKVRENTMGEVKDAPAPVTFGKMPKGFM